MQNQTRCILLTEMHREEEKKPVFSFVFPLDFPVSVSEVMRLLPGMKKLYQIVS